VLVRGFATHLACRGENNLRGQRLVEVADGGAPLCGSNGGGLWLGLASVCGAEHGWLGGLFFTAWDLAGIRAKRAKKIMLRQRVAEAQARSQWWREGRSRAVAEMMQVC